MINNVRPRSDGNLEAAAAVVHPIQPALTLLHRDMLGHDTGAPCNTGGQLGHVVQHFAAGQAHNVAHCQFG